ncbi:hypothetical protein Ancab_005197 [Ancistrocladus abbreviatus]
MESANVIDAYKVEYILPYMHQKSSNVWPLMRYRELGKLPSPTFQHLQMLWHLVGYREKLDEETSSSLSDTATTNTIQDTSRPARMKEKTKDPRQS